MSLKSPNYIFATSMFTFLCYENQPLTVSACDPDRTMFRERSRPRGYDNIQKRLILTVLFIPDQDTTAWS